MRMRTFKINKEAEIRVKGKYELPSEWEEAVFLSRGWTMEAYRTTPHYLINRVSLIWHLDNELEKQATKDLGKPK